MEGRAKSKFLSSVSSIFTQLEHKELPISIFKVPASVASTKPEAYIPSLIGLGPYHHMRPELQQRQMCKLNEAKRIHERFRSMGFERVVELLHCLVGPAVRACYSMYLDIDDHDLAIVMAVDGLFLFELLCFHGVSGDGTARSSPPPGGGRLVRDPSCMRESMMLENQIPILVLKVLMLIESNHEARAVKELFPRMLVGYCRAVSPLGLLEDYPPCKVLSHAHLLGLLYSLIVLREPPRLGPGEEKKEERFLETVSEQVRSLQSDPVETPTPEATQSVILASAINIAGDAIPELARPVELVTRLLDLPWKELWTAISSDPPLKEETSIPGASMLHENGVKFGLADHITAINFDAKAVTFHLPPMKLNGNSEVVIRNLVAYEAMIKADRAQLVFARFVEIMSGVIATVEDVAVLKENGILELESIRDVEVVKVFKGMGKSTRPTNAKGLERAVEEVNKYYNGLWNVSTGKTIKKWSRNTWNVFRVFAILALFGILVLHTFCTVYGCSRLFVNNSKSV